VAPPGDPALVPMLPLLLSVMPLKDLLTLLMQAMI
jgi:hypothetical protein